MNGKAKKNGIGWKVAGDKALEDEVKKTNTGDTVSLVNYKHSGQ